MESIEVHARLVGEQLKVSLDRFANYLSADHDLDSLVSVEAGIDTLMDRYRQVWADLGADAASEISSEYEPLLRSFATTIAVFEVLAPIVSRRLGHRWGQHMFAADDLSLVAWDRMPEGLPAAAVRHILPDLCRDLVGAVDDLTDYVPARRVYLQGRINDALDRICSGSGADLHRAPRLRDDFQLGRVLDEDTVARELGLSVAEVHALVESRRLLSVPLWNGALGYPSFQLSRDSVRDDVTHVLEHADDRLGGWPFTLWLSLAVSKERSLGWYRAQLGNRGLWKPDWSEEATGEFDDFCENRSTVEVGCDLYRIARRTLGPFYFSTVEQIDSERVSPPDGRFDLEAGLTDLGSLYTAMSPLGACHEVLDREPVLTLEVAEERKMWTLRPLQPIPVADLRDLSTRLSSTTNRRDTQNLALGMSEAHNGLLVGLRTSGSEDGAVFFGSAGGRLPAAAGLGVWSASSDPLLVSDALWEYVERRKQDHESFPVLFRRFPEPRTGTLSPDVGVN